MRSIRWIRALAAVTVAAGCATGQEPPTDERLDARFVADRIFVRVPVTRAGDTLLFYTDTGGGLFLFGHAAERVGLGDSTAVRLSDVASGTTFPDPLGVEDRRVPIFRPEGEHGSDFDGLLGQAWFAGRAWTIDYFARTLSLRERAPDDDESGSRVPLAFRTDSTGARVLSFPRMPIAVEGDSLDMLLDTGATLVLTDSSREHFADGPDARATSFITTEVFDRWRESHPEWRVIPDADGTVEGMAMIEVPEVVIGGESVGPVWFTQRPDAAFHEYMARFMDRPVDGALGGNAFRFFTLTIDYPEAAAFFRRNATR